jgi:hypothetical protein
MPVALDALGWKLYMANGAWDAAIFGLIWMFWIETRGRTLEEAPAAVGGVPMHDAYAPDGHAAGAGLEEKLEKEAALS